MEIPADTLKGIFLTQLDKVIDKIYHINLTHVVSPGDLIRI